MLRDGRAAAFLVFEHLLGRFSDLKRNRDPDYPRDCIAKGDYVFQVRMVTANGTALNPHKQNGTRRKFDKLEYQYARQLLDGFLLVDVTACLASPMPLSQRTMYPAMPSTTTRMPGGSLTRHLGMASVFPASLPTAIALSLSLSPHILAGVLDHETTFWQPPHHC